MDTVKPDKKVDDILTILKGISLNEAIRIIASVTAQINDAAIIP